MEITKNASSFWERCFFSLSVRVFLLDISPSWPLDPLGALVPEGSQEGGVRRGLSCISLFIIIRYNPLLASPVLSPLGYESGRAERLRGGNEPLPLGEVFLFLIRSRGSHYAL